MSGSRVPHLQRRNGTYHLRVRVPDELRLRVGLREVRRSLGVHTFAEARPLALRYATRVMEVFTMARSQPMTKTAVQELVQACFHDLSRHVEGGFIPKTDSPHLELEYQHALFADEVAQLSSQLEDHRFDEPVARKAEALLRQANIAPDDLDDERWTDLCSGVARALLERERLWRFRLGERLLPYQPQDRLFSYTRQVAQVAAPVEEAIIGETLGSAVKTYLNEGRKAWAPKTFRDRARKLAYLVEHLGEDRPLGSITARDVVSYRDALRRLRRQSKRIPSGSFRSQQTENEEARISHTTAENIFVPCKAFFAWAKSTQGLITSNPAEDVRMPKPKAQKGVKSRRPFREADLKRLFAAPLFTGMKSVKRRFEPGRVRCKDAHYWLPILGYYTGARLGELVQLHLDDVELDGPVPHIMITEEGGDAGTGHEKSVKSHAGVRQVPLHPDILRLGFGAYVAKTAKQKQRRLFWQIKFGADGQASTVFSKWFARLKTKAGITDKALVFHSFRHTAEDAYRNASVPQYVIDRVIGHSGGKTSDAYGEGVSLETMYDALLKAKLPLRLTAVLD